MPSAPSSSRSPPSASRASASIHLTLTLRRWWKPPWKQRLGEALVGVFQADVLADHVDRDLVLRVLDAVEQRFPQAGRPRFVGQRQLLEDDAIDAFLGQRQRHFVDARDVAGGDHRVFVDVAEQRDLALDVARQHAVGAAQQDVGLDPDRAQVAHAVLRRLGLELAGRADMGHQRQVDVQRVLAAHVLPELANRLEERQALDVADRAADLDEHDVDAVGDGQDRLLDGVGDVRE